MIYLISGKRASGKDTFCNIFIKLLTGKNISVALADSPKLSFCQKRGLDYSRFMTDRKYKDSYRKEFIDFAEEAKICDKYVWCKTAMKGLVDTYDNVIVTDLRYPVELEYFSETFGTRENNTSFVKIRIKASENVRASRGWSYCKGVDDHLSEIGMDTTDFNFVIRNDVNDNGDSICKQIKDLKICRV